MTLGKSLSLSVPQCPPLKMESCPGRPLLPTLGVMKLQPEGFGFSTFPHYRPWRRLVDIFPPLSSSVKS